MGHFYIQRSEKNWIAIVTVYLHLYLKQSLTAELYRME